MLGVIIGDLAGAKFGSGIIKEANLLDHNCSLSGRAKIVLEAFDIIKDGKNDQHIQINDVDKSLLAFACTTDDSAEEETKRLNLLSKTVSLNEQEAKDMAIVLGILSMAAKGNNILDMRDYVDKSYRKMNFTLDYLKNNTQDDVLEIGCVPLAIEALLESTGFEDAIRKALTVEIDTRTVASITGGLAEAYYGIPLSLREHALTFLDEQELALLLEFETANGTYIEKNGIRVKTNTHVKPKGGRSEMLNETNKKTKKKVEEGNEVEETTSQKLFNHLYEACNILRGPINQDEYKSYVTPILFFKRISDVYDEETDKALKESGGDVVFASFEENHSFSIPEGCHWSDVRNASSNVGVSIVNAMSGIERANPDTLSGVFSSFDDAVWTDKTKLSDERLKNLVEHMSKIKVGNENYSADVMGDAYEYLIKKFADLSKKNAGEFYTPRTIVKLLVNLLDPKPGEDCYDPACGTGGMLIECVHHINSDRSTYGRIYGQENNLSTSAIARMNLFLHGGKDFKIVQGDTLRNPKFLKAGKVQKFDCVIANPPFGLDKWGADQFAVDPYGRNIWGTPSDSNADWAWIQHMVSSMKDKTGRCAVIMPQGVLFHAKTEQEMREQLVKTDMVECVITFVGGLFYNAGVSACVLLLNNGKKAERKGKICLIDATTIYTAKRAQNIMTEENISEVLGLYENYTNVIEKCQIIRNEDVKDTLIPKMYIQKKESERIDSEEIKRSYLTAYKKMLIAEQKMRKLIEEGGYINE